MNKNFLDSCNFSWLFDHHPLFKFYPLSFPFDYIFSLLTMHRRYSKRKYHSKYHRLMHIFIFQKSSSSRKKISKQNQNTTDQSFLQEVQYWLTFSFDVNLDCLADFLCYWNCQSNSSAVQVDISCTRLRRRMIITACFFSFKLVSFFTNQRRCSTVFVIVQWRSGWSNASFWLYRSLLR